MASYACFERLEQVLALPRASALDAAVLHRKGARFEDECAPFLVAEYAAFYEAPEAASDFASGLGATGVSFRKLAFPRNGYVLSVQATRVAYFLPKNGSRPTGTPLSLHECSRVEIALLRGGTQFVDASQDPALRGFDWARLWEERGDGVAPYVACDTVQRIADDLHDLAADPGRRT